jgi:hypothetical protein
MVLFSKKHLLKDQQMVKRIQSLKWLGGEKEEHHCSTVAKRDSTRHPTIGLLLDLLNKEAITTTTISGGQP